MARILLRDLIGNEHIKQQIAIACSASRKQNKAIGHMLLAGSAGCGKTSTSKAVAHQTNGLFMEVAAESLKTAEDIAKVLFKFPPDGYNKFGQKVGPIKPGILFIDEAHRMSLKSQEVLGIAMENFDITFTTGRGKSKRTVTSPVPEFTVICATTKEGDLSKPFRDRFKSTFIFSAYSLEDSVKIIMMHAARYNLTVTEQAAVSIAKRGRGTPRKLVRYLEKVHEYMSFLDRQVIDEELAEAFFGMVSINHEGLDSTDITILKELYESGTPKGLDSLSVKTMLDPRTVLEVHEPYLIGLGFLERGRGGRVITEKGSKYLETLGYVETKDEEAEGFGMFVTT